MAAHVLGAADSIDVRCIPGSGRGRHGTLLARERGGVGQRVRGRRRSRPAAPRPVPAAASARTAECIGRRWPPLTAHRAARISARIRRSTGIGWVASVCLRVRCRASERTVGPGWCVHRVAGQRSSWSGLRQGQGARRQGRRERAPLSGARYPMTADAPGTERSVHQDCAGPVRQCRARPRRAKAPPTCLAELGISNSRPVAEPLIEPERVRGLLLSRTLAPLRATSARTYSFSS